MSKKAKNFFLVGFLLSLGIFFYFLFAAARVLAVDVNVSASVPEICGNGVKQSSEECDDGNTTGGDGCSSICELEGGPPPLPCVPKPAFLISCTDCIGGSKTCTWGNTCSTWQVVSSCVVCGDGNIGAGEECDDGNTASGDGCSATCQLEIGCGNGSLDPGEQCDDNNLVSGDCCSATCQWELNINPNVTETVTNTTASLSWSIQCHPTGQNISSILEWGKTIAVNEGSASGFSGVSNSYTISNLTPSTVYYYRITATSGALTDIQTGSFQTSGGVENCNNGIDDDHDGFCDYLASTCTDGSTPGDPECACEANFLCTPGPCGGDNHWTVSCVDQTQPKCEPDYNYPEECSVCPGVFCQPCQELDTKSCTCVTKVNCCGNDICEPPQEDPYNCLIDCPVDCLSDWQCSEWQPEFCPPSGIQTRQCFDTKACPVPINPPPVQRSCSDQCPGLFCGACQQIDLEQCMCQEISPCCGNGICEAGESFNSCPQDCIQTCTPSWTCLAWGECVAGIQQRECYDLNNCDLNLDRPPEVRSCDPNCDLACSICSHLDLATCRCLPIIPCCGNRSCEESETNWSCKVDCAIPPTLRITLTDCLDGLDNDKDGLVDYPADPGCSKPYDTSELNAAEIIQNISKFLSKQVLDNPVVEQTNEKFAAPAIITMAAVSTFSTFSFFNFFSYLQYFFTQPFAVFARRKRKKWGIVYNSLTKQPVDLAIVRLYKKENGQLVQSRVTDKQGRYVFIVASGQYYLTVTKPNFEFPTVLLRDKKEDAKFLDLYHGETINVTDKNVAITANIPLDPIGDARPAAKIIFQYYLRKIQYVLSFSAVPLAATSAVISPGPFTFTLFAFHCLLFILFRRLGYQRPPKSWGMVYDKGTSKPLGLAITRIYDKQFNKLLETRVTDARGRYAFLVDNNIYYLTADKAGYTTSKTSDIDLVSKGKESIVGLNIGLEKGKGVPSVTPEMPMLPPTQPTPPPFPSPTATPPVSPPPPATPSVTPPAPESKMVIPAELSVPPTPVPIKEEGKPALIPTDLEQLEEKVSHLEVGRQSLEELMKAKKSVAEIKEDIVEQKEKLEDLTEKVEKIEDKIEEGIKEGEESKIENQDKKAPSQDGEGGDKPPAEKSIFG